MSPGAVPVRMTDFSRCLNFWGQDRSQDLSQDLSQDRLHFLAINRTFLNPSGATVPPPTHTHTHTVHRIGGSGDKKKSKKSQVKKKKIEPQKKNFFCFKIIFK